MAACRSAIERKTPRRMRWRVIFEKKFSTALSQEAEVGVKWKVQRGWRASQASTPAFARAGFWGAYGWRSCGVVVENGMDRLVGRDLAFDGIEKADEFEMTVALHAAADDVAVEHAERREQRGGAVPLVIMGHRLAAPRLDRQSRLGAVERLDLALLVDRQYHRVSRRIEVEPGDVG